MNPRFAYVDRREFEPLTCPINRTALANSNRVDRGRVELPTFRMQTERSSQLS